MFIADLKSGHEYSELPETICLNIINFIMFDCKEYHSHFQILEKNRHELLNDKFAIHFYELPKISKGNLEDAIVYIHVCQRYDNKGY
ncbi:MAG: PD-(D/E)XK nuclease family transposase [Oscillospiraceae bacterium]|nr:PD-(D/E)XK nuclease family transposase [Oscillospiraceae bacterium]